MDAVLGRKILDIIDAHPEKLEMSTFGRHFPRADGSCRTVACLAGWTLLQSGYKLDRDEVYVRPDGTSVDFEANEAQMLLGMTRQDAFYGYTGSVPAVDGRIWFDYKNGPDRFRKLVEETEGKQA